MKPGFNNPKLARFLGHGDVFVDGRRVHGWRVKCSECNRDEVIVSAGSRSLPPEIIVKKLTKSGWIVGNKPTGDVCAQCQRKPIASRVGLAKQALSFLAAPVVGNGTTTMHYSELLALALKLPPDQIRQMIKSLREVLPQPEHKPKPKPVPAPAYDNDVEYAQWLEQQESGSNT